MYEIPILSVIFQAFQAILTPVPPYVPVIGEVIVFAPMVGGVLSRVMDARVVPVFIPAAFVALNCTCFTPLDRFERAHAEKVYVAIFEPYPQVTQETGDAQEIFA